MKRYIHLTAILWALALVAGVLITPNQSAAATAAEINRDVKIALEKLYAKSSSAKMLGEKAKGILVFPGIVKGGFMVGGAFGEGAFLRGGKASRYYNTLSASYGLQIGVQKYG